jgi:hypothetical protein
MCHLITEFILACRAAHLHGHQIEFCPSEVFVQNLFTKYMFFLRQICRTLQKVFIY